MIDLIAAFIIARVLSARAKAKGYPGLISAVGVIAFVSGDGTGLLFGARLGLHWGALVTGYFCAVLLTLVAFAGVRHLPDRSNVHEKDRPRSF